MRSQPRSGGLPVISRWTLFASLILCPFSPRALPGQEARPARETVEFPIVCFLGPPANNNVREHWQRIKDANFTLVLPSYRYDDDDQLKMLAHCRAVGLKGVVNVKRLAPPGSADSPPADWKTRIEAAVERFADHPALYAYMVRDEPGADLFPQLGRVVDELKQRDPRHITCINLFPVHATNKQLQTSGYVEYLESYLTTVKPPFLCYDLYPFLKSGSDRPDFFHNLELARAAGAKHDTPVWTVVLSGWGTLFRKPTPAELRWQAYSALAYGVKGLAYFAYWPTSDKYAAVVDYAGRPQPLYNAMRTTNAKTLAFGRILKKAVSTAVFHTGASIPRGCRRLPDDVVPLKVSREVSLVIGLFEDASAARYAMIVNRDYRESVTVPLQFSPSVQQVSLFDADDDLFDRPHKRQSLNITLPPGDAALLRFQVKSDRQPSSVTVPSRELRDSLQLDGFYQKHVSAGGLPILASAKVNDAALREAAWIIERMLEGRRDILNAIVKNKTRFVIMATTEMTTDIPEHRKMTPKDFWDRRARGLGATPSNLASSCGEENLLACPGDPYHAENILVHEFAHTIHHMGLDTIDSDFDSKLRAVYEQAMQEGLWKSKYASNNRAEYWAEGVQSYFGTNRPPDHDHNHVDTRDELKEYDPRLFKLIDKIFRGNNWRYTHPTKRQTAGHLKSVDREKLPEFSWPERLKDVKTR